jgi:hypothetical protein
VERIFLDIMDRCRPRELTVYARYLRRGGIDINPCRSTEKGITVAPALWRASSHRNKFRGGNVNLLALPAACKGRASSIQYAPRFARPRQRHPGSGEVSEWLKEHAWKVCIR